MADLLFIGGGLSAAAILAQGQFLEELGGGGSPVTMGEMVAPFPPSTPQPAGAPPVSPEMPRETSKCPPVQGETSSQTPESTPTPEGGFSFP